MTLADGTDQPLPLVGVHADAAGLLSYSLKDSPAARRQTAVGRLADLRMPVARLFATGTTAAVRGIVPLDRVRPRVDNREAILDDEPAAVLDDSLDAILGAG